jgi:hypothetical protein
MFYVQGTVRYGHDVGRTETGVYQIAPGWGPAKGIVFEGNRYAGRQIDRPEDAEGVISEAAAAPRLEWRGPPFNPAHPDGFDAFLEHHRQWMLRLFQEQFGQVRLGR